MAEGVSRSKAQGWLRVMQQHEFLLAVLDDGVRELVSYLEHRIRGADGARARTRRWVEGVLAQALDPEAAQATRPFVIPQARLSERFPDEVARCADQLAAPLREVIEAGRASGELPGADPGRDASAIYDLAMGWLQRALLESGAPSRADADHVLAFAMHGLER